MSETRATITTPISLGKINTITPVFLHANFKESKAIAKYDLGYTDEAGNYTFIREAEYTINDTGYENMKTAFANTDFSTVTLEQFALSFAGSIDPSLALQ